MWPILFFYQIESLESKLKHAKDELDEKEFNILQQEQEINRLKKEIERKQQRVKDMEKVSFFLA